MTDALSPASRSADRSLADKLALAAGPGAVAAAMAVLPASVGAVIVPGFDSNDPGVDPLAPPDPVGNFATRAETEWDVDGDGLVDFGLENVFSTVADLADRSDGNGRLVVPDVQAVQGMAKLNAGVIVGQTIVGTGASAFKFHTNVQTRNPLTFFGAIATLVADGGWSLGDTGFFGFRFENASGVHYGWGELDLFGAPTAFPGSPGGNGFRVLRAFYESDAGVSIEVGQTSGGGPAPTPAPSTLALLAMGAVGVGAWRRRRDSAAKSA